MREIEKHHLDILRYRIVKNNQNEHWIQFDDPELGWVDFDYGIYFASIHYIKWTTYSSCKKATKTLSYWVEHMKFTYDREHSMVVVEPPCGTCRKPKWWQFWLTTPTGDGE
jgi:hypothetical protein